MSSAKVERTASDSNHAAMLYHLGTLDQMKRHRASHRIERSRELAIYMLTSGFSQAYHQRALGVSDTTVSKLIHWSRAAASEDSTIAEAAKENAASITAEDGLKMAQIRGTAHLPWWSRLAIAEFANRLGSTAEVASLFRCSRRTVQLVQKKWPISFDVLTGDRRLSSTQISPPGARRSREPAR